MHRHHRSSDPAVVLNVPRLFSERASLFKQGQISRVLGVPNLLLPCGGWVMKCSGTQHVLGSMCIRQHQISKAAVQCSGQAPGLWIWGSNVSPLAQSGSGRLHGLNLAAAPADRGGGYGGPRFDLYGQLS